MPSPSFAAAYVFCAAVGLIAVAVVLVLPLGGWDRVAVLTAVSVGASLWVTVGMGGGGLTGRAFVTLRRALRKSPRFGTGISWSCGVFCVFSSVMT